MWPDILGKAAWPYIEGDYLLEISGLFCGKVSSECLITGQDTKCILTEDNISLYMLL